MKILRYIELKSGHSDNGPAWIGYAQQSKWIPRAYAAGLGCSALRAGLFPLVSVRAERGEFESPNHCSKGFFLNDEDPEESRRRDSGNGHVSGFLICRHTSWQGCSWLTQCKRPASIRAVLFREGRLQSRRKSLSRASRASFEGSRETQDSRCPNSSGQQMVRYKFREDGACRSSITSRLACRYLR